MLAIDAFTKEACHHCHVSMFLPMIMADLSLSTEGDMAEHPSPEISHCSHPNRLKKSGGVDVGIGNC